MTKDELRRAFEEARRRMLVHRWATNPIRLRGQGDARFLDDDWRNASSDAMDERR